MNEVSFLEHLIELRRRLIYCVVLFVIAFFIAFFFAKDIFNFLLVPLADLWEGEGRRVIFTALHEQFLTEIRLAFFSAFLVSFPLIAMQCWIFIAPGLYKNEKRSFFPFMIATPFLFFAGAAFVYYVVMPIAWGFFAGFEQSSQGSEVLQIALEPKVNEYLSLVMRLILVFGFCFELPVFLMLLVRSGLVSVQTLRNKRRYAILIAFIFAALLTPPDPISQIALALPMLILYEISILGSLFIQTKEQKQHII